jgi:ABC-type Fe3+-hydroxamate transport system substrate-binding protein
LGPAAADVRGNTDERPLRIASLVPSLTELLAELGLADALVARTRYCVHPVGLAERVPAVGGTKDVDLARLRELAPSHVVVNVDENRREAVDAIRAWDPAPVILVTHPKHPHDNLALIDRFAAVFGAVPGVRAHAARWRSAVERALAETRPEGRAERRVLYLIWRKPWMTVARDTYISRLLARVAWTTWPPVEGGEQGAGRYPSLSGEEPWLADIDELLLSSEPFPFGERHLADAQALCPKARVRVVDGERLGWYGTRAVAGLDYLRGLADDVGPAPAAGDNAAWRSSSP